MTTKTTPFSSLVTLGVMMVVGYRQVLSVLGASRYQARDLVSRDAVLDVTGTAIALINASDTISGQVSGAASVRYLGAPDVSVSVLGAATIVAE